MVVLEIIKTTFKKSKSAYLLLLLRIQKYEIFVDNALFIYCGVPWNPDKSSERVLNCTNLAYHCYLYQQPNNTVIPDSDSDTYLEDILFKAKIPDEPTYPVILNPPYQDLFRLDKIIENNFTGNTNLVVEPTKKKIESSPTHFEPIEMKFDESLKVRRNSIQN